MPRILFDVAAIIALMYIGGPILMLFVMRMKARPRLEPLDTYNLPPDVWGFLNWNAEALRTIGFVPTAYVSLPNGAPNVKTYLVMLVNEAAGDKAMITAMFANQNGMKKSTLYIEFSTRFESGSCVDTMNSRVVSTFHPIPGDVKTRVPGVQDPLELYRLHQYVMATRGAGGNKILYGGDTAIGYLARIWVESFQKQVGYGLLRFNERSDVYQPTIKGAFLMTWGQLWPVSAIRRARTADAGSRLLKAMKDDIASGRWTPPLQPSDPLSAQNAWIV